jgi:hypothetical protein
MNSKELRVTLRGNKNKLKFTISLRDLKEMNLVSGDYTRITVEGKTYDFILRVPKKSPSRKGIQFKSTFPQDMAKKLNFKRGDIIRIKISKIDNFRGKKVIYKNKIDISSIIPLQYNFKQILVESLENDRILVWFDSCTKPKPIVINRFIQLNKELGGFFGLMQAESRKKGKKFDFTNKLHSEVLFFKKMFNKFGVKEKWEYTLYYNPNKINLQKEMNIMKKRFTIPIKNVSCIEQNNLTDVAYSIHINSTILRIIMLSLLKSLRNQISTCNGTFKLKDFATGFIIKYLAGDGHVCINNANSGLDVIITEKDKLSQLETTQILNNLNINSNLSGIKIKLSSNLKSMLWYLNHGAFLNHTYNRYKLVHYFLNLHYIKKFYKRFKYIKSISIKEFAKLNDLSYSSSSAYLNRHSKLGTLELGGKGTYKINEKGSKLIVLIKKIKDEYNSLQPLITPNGRSLATRFPIPTSCATLTTSETDLYAPGASSVIPLIDADLI